MLEFKVLGTLEVLLDGTRVRLPGNLTRKVLAVLLIRGGTPIRTSALIGLLWTGSPPKTAEAEIRNAVRDLRRVFRTSCCGLTVDRDESGYFIKTGSDQLDMNRFIELAALASEAADRSDLGAAWEYGNDALSQWRGDEPMDGLDCPGLADTVSELKEMRAAVREELCAAGLRSGRSRKVLPTLRLLAKANPMSESVHKKLMLALYRAGRQDEALGSYSALRARLSVELGIDPSADLVQLYQRILRHDPTLNDARPGEATA